MMHKRYWMAHDCPNCGGKDDGRWGGGRMMCTTWGHDFSCCSEKCGLEFSAVVREKSRTKEGRDYLAKLWGDLQSQSDSRLCGEPYAGYDAEQQLKRLGRY